MYCFIVLLSLGPKVSLYAAVTNKALDKQSWYKIKGNRFGVSLNLLRNSLTLSVR